MPGLAGQTLTPGQHASVDGPALGLGERWQASLALTVSGRQLPGGDTNYIANIQAPEIEASVRYDFLNSVLRTEWETRGGSSPRAIAWDAGYRIEGNATYDSISNRLLGSLTAYIYAGPTGQVASVSNFFSESFAFDLNLTTKTFSDLGQTIVGKTPVHLPDASISTLRSLYRSMLLTVVTNPGPFVREGKFSALAGVQLERPVFEYDPATEGLALNLRGKLFFNFSDGKRDQGLPIPFSASCSATFQNTAEGLVLKPRVRLRWTPLLRPRGAIFKLVFGEVCSGFLFVVFLAPQFIWKERATGPTPWSPPPPVSWGSLFYRQRRSDFKLRICEPRRTRRMAADVI